MASAKAVSRKVLRLFSINTRQFPLPFPYAAHYLNDFNSVACSNRNIFLGMKGFNPHNVSGPLVLFTMWIEINRLSPTTRQVERKSGN